MSADQTPDDRHLDHLALDALRAGEGTPESAAHAGSCPRCRAALAEMRLLESQLRGAQPPLPAVPPEVEVRIFRAYRNSLGRRSQAPLPGLLRRWSLPAAGLAAAAALMLTLRLGPPAVERVETPHEPSPLMLAPSTPGALEAPQPAAAVDIVDAFRLARALRDRRQVAAGWDADGDGTIDGADVEALARRAVAL